eukprot:1595782-Amphidinium_carterae.1
MTDPAFRANATAAGFTPEQSTMLETAVRGAVSMARQERDQLSAQVVHLQQAIQVSTHSGHIKLDSKLGRPPQQQAIQVSTPSGHIKLDSKLGRPPGLAGDGKNWEEFAFKLVAHTATFSCNASSLLRSIEERSEDQSLEVMTVLNEHEARVIFYSLVMLTSEPPSNW